MLYAEEFPTKESIAETLSEMFYGKNDRKINMRVYFSNQQAMDDFERMVDEMIKQESLTQNQINNE